VRLIATSLEGSRGIEIAFEHTAEELRMVLSGIKLAASDADLFSKDPCG
jgi:hypothetical protein